MPYQHKKEDVCQWLTAGGYNKRMAALEQWKIENEGLILSPEARFRPVTEEEFRRLRILYNCTPRRPYGELFMRHSMEEVCRQPDPQHYRSAQMVGFQQAVAAGTADPSNPPDHLTNDEFWMLKLFKCPKEDAVDRQTGELLNLHMLEHVCRFANVGNYNADLMSQWSGKGERPDQLTEEEFNRLQTICASPGARAQTIAEQMGQVAMEEPTPGFSWEAPADIRERLTRVAAEPERITQQQWEAIQLEEKRARTFKAVAWTAGIAVGASLLVGGALWLASRKPKRRRGKRS